MISPLVLEIPIEPKVPHVNFTYNVSSAPAMKSDVVSAVVKVQVLSVWRDSIVKSNLLSRENHFFYPFLLLVFYLRYNLIHPGPRH